MGPHLSAVAGTHEALPKRGTLRRERDNAAVNPPAPWDHPLLATCLQCGKVIRRKDSLLSDWEHAE